MHQNWMRDYDPTTGRYLEPDPLGLVDGASVYGYVRQNPGRWTDPRGEEAYAAVSGAAAADLLKPDKSDLNPLKWAAYGCAAVVALAIDGLTSEGCGCEDDCPDEMPVKQLTRLNDRDPRLKGLDVHSLKPSGGAEDLYVSRNGCLYVGPAKNSREWVGGEAMAYSLGIKI